MISYNIKFPLTDSPDTNTYFSTNQVSKDALTSDLLLLLLTQRGERYMMPQFGTGLLKYVFEMNDQNSASDIEEEIKNTVSLYIPALKITKVTFNWNIDDNGNPIPETQINVNILFQYSQDNFFENGSLDLSF